MADEKVDILLKVKVHDRQLKELMVKIKALEQMERRLSSGSRMQGYANKMADSNRKWVRSFDQIDAAVKMTGKGLTKFLGGAIKGVLLEMGLLSVALVGIHALFAAGRLLVKAYHGAMSLLAGGAAIAGAAIATVSAAIREQQAAMFAYRGKGAPQFGSAMNQTRMAMRNLQSDASLASLGIETLNKAFGVMSKTMDVNQINASGKAIKALMDFGAAGQDPAKSIEGVATVVAALSDPKKGINQVLSAARQLGPEMQKALKNAKIKTKKQFEELLYSGKLAEMGGVTGQFDAINNTLIAQLKAYFTRLRGAFADFGDVFLEPLKVAFDKIFYIIRDGLTRMSVSIQQVIGVENVTNGVVKVVEKTTNFVVKMIREYLPGVVGMFKRIGDWWDRFTSGWKSFFDKLRPLQDGARSLYKALKPIWEAIKDGSKNLFLFNQLLQDNEGTVVETGQKIADLIRTASDLFFNLKKVFMEIAPFINDLLTALNQIFKMLSKIMTIGQGSGLASALAPLIAMSVIGRKMGAVKGMMMPNYTQGRFASISISAASVTIAGPGGIGSPIPGYGYGPGSSTTGRLSSGKGVAALEKASSAAKLTPQGKPKAAPEKLSSALDAAGSGAKLASKGTPTKTPGVPPGTKLPTAQLWQYQKGVLEPGTFQDIRTSMSMGNIAAIKSGSQLLTQGMDMQQGAAIRAADAARAQADLIRNQRMIAQMQQNAAPNSGLSAAFAARTNQQIMSQMGLPGPSLPPTSARDFARLRRQARINYLKTRTQIGLKGASARLAYGARSTVGGVRGLMSRMSGAYYDPSTGQMENPEANRLAIEKQFSGTLEFNDEGEYVSGDPRGKFTRGIAKRRALLRNARNKTRFGAAQQRFGQSHYGRIGTSVGLTLASQYAPEEMRGAMALGATAAMMDPRLGIAVAGVGGALTAKSSGLGALSGLAGGAQVGAMIGGPYGAIIGGAIGAVVGGISGSINKGKAALEELRKRVQKQFDDFYASMNKAMRVRLDYNIRRVEAGESINGAGVMTGAAMTISQRKSRTARGLMGAMQGKSNLAGILNAYKTGALGSMTASDFYKNFKYSPDELEALLQNPQYANAMQYSTYVQEYLKQNGIEFDPAKQVPGGKAYSYSGAYLNEQKGYGTIQQVETGRLNELTRISGKSVAELEVLAAQLGVDLYNPMTKFNDLLQELGLTVKKTLTDLKNSVADAMIAASGIFRTERETKEAQYALDQMTAGLGAQLDSQNLSKAEKQDAVKSYFEQYSALAMTAAGGDPIAALLATRKSFEAGPTGGAFAPNQALAGQYETVQPIYQQYMSKTMEGVGQSFAGQVQAELLAAGFSADFGQISRAIAGMDVSQLETFMNQITNGTLLQTQIQLPSGQVLEQTAGDAFKDLFPDVAVTQSNTAALDNVANHTDLLTAEVKTLTPEMKGLRTALEAYNKARGITTPPDPMGGDTRTPRGDTTSSRLSHTLARHSAFDSMVSGNRTITSSYRNFALGSMNSDHVTGRAYDLTGQNLGQYARLVHDNGGFAEFHGTMANRHLHVVPGVGDTAMPAMPMQMMNQQSGSGGNTNYYNIEINGANQSPEQIANMVIAKIDQRERSYAERI